MDHFPGRGQRAEEGKSTAIKGRSGSEGGLGGNSVLGMLVS